MAVMRHYSWISCLMVLLACSSSAWAMDLTAYAKPDAILVKDYAAQRLVLWRSLLVEAYDKHGDHSQSTDAEMTTLLTFMATNVVALAPSNSAMKILAERLAGEGGNPDPLAAFSWFYLCLDQGRKASNEACVKAMTAFKNDDPTHQPPRYAHLLRAMVYVHALSAFHPKAHPDQLERANAIADLLRDQLVASVLAHEFDQAPGSLLRCVRRIDLEQSDKAEDLIAALTAAFDTAKTDPWIAHATLTSLSIETAWTWRGSGWSSSVTPEGWKGFERHLTAAESHLTEAYRLHPGEPLLAAMGITLAGAGHSTITMKEWLRRGVAACLDAPEPWDQMRSFGTPRWGGSYDQLLALGCDAVATKRFDTSVPRQLFLMIACVEADARSIKKDDDKKAPLSTARVRQAVTECIAGYVAHDPATAAEYQCLEVGYLWHCGDQAGARKALLAIDPTHRHPGAAMLMNISYEQILSETEPAAKNSF